MTIRETVTHNTGAAAPVAFLLFVVFLVLKLTHVIGWSWWLVTVPLWGPSAAVLAVVAVLFAIGALFLGLAKLAEHL